MSVKHGQLIRLHLDPALIQREMEELPLCLPHCGDSSECDTNVQCDDVPTANIFQTWTDADGYGIDKKECVDKAGIFFKKITMQIILSC
jgi:hypothetical protein